MRPPYAKITGFDLYHANGPTRPPYVDVKVQLYPDLVPGGPPTNGLSLEAIVAIDPMKDTLSEINKKAAEKMYATIQSAAKLSLADIEAAIEYSLEYDENRAR